MAPHFKLSAKMSPKCVQEREYMTHVPYASAVGSLMYAMVCTRPNLSQAVSMVSRYMHDPGQGHWEAVKWTLRYIKGTIDVGLVTVPVKIFPLTTIISYNPSVGPITI